MVLVSNFPIKFKTTVTNPIINLIKNNKMSNQEKKERKKNDKLNSLRPSPDNENESSDTIDWEQDESVKVLMNKCPQ